MSSFQVVDSSPGSSVSIMETSNFAHVIFQNVGKSFLPQAPLECRYTLTPYITPHPKDWVGIFKVPHTRMAAAPAQIRLHRQFCESHLTADFCPSE
ncbi:unnamed protein product [Menidia menidia]|uniref:(Atlantic silverside) hypothetical protein n=1 Tax=Menidia menidia TaxID=238744 RepID=A0A8S4AS19_9TELE|nr:unnamed protein product [Menidia menidia]